MRITLQNPEWRELKISKALGRGDERFVDGRRESVPISIGVDPEAASQGKEETPVARVAFDTAFLVAVAVVVPLISGELETAS